MTIQHARQIAAALRPNSTWADRVLAGQRDDDDAVQAATAALGIYRGTIDLWLPIAKFDGWPTGESNPVFVAVTADGHKPVVGEAYFDPDAYDGTWWWAGTRKDDYHESPIEEMQHGAVTYFQPMPAPPSLSTIEGMGGTDNAILLLGYVAGAVSRDGVYEFESADPVSGEQVIRHCTSGNLYSVAVRQIEGVE